MTDYTTARDTIAASLHDSGFTGRGAIWRRRGKDVQWVVHIDRLPYGSRLAVDIGLDLQLDSTPRRPTDCPILLHIENLKLSTSLNILEALDLDSGLADSDRAHELTALAEALASYISDRLTFDSVRDSYRVGDFASGFIHKNARALLEATNGAEEAGGREP